MYWSIVYNKDHWEDEEGPEYIYRGIIIHIHVTGEREQGYKSIK